jgi:predicted flap endonuclease-1-like 5' DNA nuclease
MGSFLRGILIGLGLGVLVAPMRGQEMRRLLSERFQEMRGYLPEKTELNQYTQQISERTTQTASTLKEYASQATVQVKDTASNLGSIAQQASSSVKDTASSLGNVAQQASSDAKSTLGNVAQQASSSVKDTASNIGDAAQQASSSVKSTTSNVSNAAQKASSNVRDTSKNAVNTTKQVTTQTQQKVQSQSSPLASSSNAGPVGPAPASGDSLSTIPGIEPEIQSKLEAQGIYTTKQLLDQTTSKEERANLAQKAGMSTHMLKTLADRADLMRLKGVSSDVATLLEEAGVGGCRDLRRRNPEHLHATLMEAQESGNSAYSTPGLDKITQWIAEAMAITSSTQE